MLLVRIRISQKHSLLCFIGCVTFAEKGWCTWNCFGYSILQCNVCVASCKTIASYNIVFSKFSVKKFELASKHHPKCFNDYRKITRRLPIFFRSLKVCKDFWQLPWWFGTTFEGFLASVAWRSSQSSGRARKRAREKRLKDFVLTLPTNSLNLISLT